MSATPKFCGKCGAPVSKQSTRYCGKCGSAIIQPQTTDGPATRSMITNVLLTLLAVPLLTLAACHFEADANTTMSSEDAEFLSEMNELLREPDELDVYQENPNIPAATTPTAPTLSTPSAETDNNGESPGLYLMDTGNKTNSRPDDPAVRLARPSDPDPEPDEPSLDLYNIIGDAVDGDGTIVAGVLLLLLLIGVGITVWVLNKNGNGKQKPPSAESAGTFCRQCGAPISPEQKFCTNCGEKV